MKVRKGEIGQTADDIKILLGLLNEKIGLAFEEPVVPEKPAPPAKAQPKPAATQGKKATRKPAAKTPKKNVKAKPEEKTSEALE